MKEVEAAVQGSSQGMGRNGLGRIPSLEAQPHGEGSFRPLFSEGAAGSRIIPDENHIHTNGSVATGTGQYVNYDAYSDESDAEAAAGIAMMQMAEEEDRAEAERQRSRGGTISSLFPTYASQPAVPTTIESPREASSDSDYAHHDLALYGGGYEGQMHYGDTPADDGLLPAFHFTTPARVDTGGTGGLSEPNALGRRLSFDYGDEDADPMLSMGDDDIPSGGQSPEKGEPADLFYHPGMRPLPPAPVESASNADVLAHLIPAGTYRNSQYGGQESQYRPLPQPMSSDSSAAAYPNMTFRLIVDPDITRRQRTSC